MRVPIILCIAAFGLSACSASKLFKDDPAPPEQQASAENEDVVAPPEPDGDIEQAPVEPAPKPRQTATGPMGPKDIMGALANKTFAYSNGAASGTVSYFSDGTFTYKEKGKGEGTGVWQASSGKLCEALDPSSFLPKGSRSECNSFSGADGSYQAGRKRLNPV
jgi:hypothetical protein